MLAHYLTIALRSIRRQRLNAALGVAVLAMGLACFLAAHRFVSYVRSYDTGFPNAERIYVVYESVEVPRTGLRVAPMNRSTRRLAEHLRLEAPELDAVARYQPAFNAFVTVGGDESFRQVAIVEPEFLDVFAFEPLEGELDAALAKPRSAVITAQAAEALFGRRDVVGETVTLTVLGRMDVTITAVVAEPPRASHLRRGLFATGFELLVSWDVGEAVARFPQDDAWSVMPVTTYVLLPANGSLSVAELERRLAGIVQRHVPADQGFLITFSARPVSAVTADVLQSQFEGYYGAGWTIDVLEMLLLFCGAILAVACLNFINLATAEALGRARETGTRKALGAAFGQVVRQELTQTALKATAAAALALAVIALAYPVIDEPWRQAFAMPWTEPRWWLTLALLVGVVTLGAGLYPALVLARVRPATALRLGTMRAGPRVLRALLVGSQFAAATFLVVAVVVCFAQRRRVREALLGRFDDQYVIVPPPSQQQRLLDSDVLTAELLREPSIEGVTSVQVFPLQPVSFRRPFTRTRGDQDSPLFLENALVGYDYFDVMDVPILAGRVFSRDLTDETSPSTQEELQARQGRPIRIVLDRQAARALGWSDPAEAVGEVLYAFGQVPHEVIGVVDDVPSRVRASDADGGVFLLNPQLAMTHVVRVSQDDVDRALEHIERVLKVLLPDRPPPRRFFLDEAFDNAYWAFEMINRVIGALALSALAIAGIGLFGMVSYMTSRRTREIGLRKSQGASSGQILRLLLVEFAKPVVLANVIVWPVAFVAADRYLRLFAERIALTPAPFVVALLATLGIAWLAVGARAVRAARMRPTDALRHE